VTYDPTPVFLTLKLALVTTLILTVVGIPLAWWIAFSKNRLRYAVEAFVTMPLVLPPTVLGFYLLYFLGPASPVGEALQRLFDVRLVFTFGGLVVGSVIFSLPFMVNPIKAGFESVPAALIEAAYTLGKSRREILWRVLLPNIKPALLTGVVMAFIHTVGEFGVVLMIGGNIPGKTRLVSMAIYEHVESLNYAAANFYSLIMVVVSFVILFVFYLFNRRIKVF
jgi:molybdate transport system permease protein